MHSNVQEQATPALPPGEFRALLRLAVPVVVTQLGLMLFGVVDTIMIGRYSADALASVGAGHIFSAFILYVGFGLVQGLDPLISQAVGAGRADKVAAHFKRGLVVAVGIAFVATLLMLNAAPLLRLFGQEEGVVTGGTRYVRIVSFANVPFMVTVLLRQTLTAHGIVRPMLIATAIANVFNVGANWVLVYGKLGFPEMGLEGLAWSTTAGRFLLFGLFAFLTRATWLPWLRAPGTETRRGYGAMLYLGAPLALQITLEAGVFHTVGFIMGTIGALELAANFITLNLASVSFMVPMGVSVAVSTRVGNAIGRGDSEGARQSARAGFLLGVGFMVASGLLFLLLPRTLAELYSDDAATVALTTALIPIAGCFAIFDGTQVVAYGVLRGAADTRFPAYVSLAAYWVLALPIGLLLTFGGETWPQGLWWGLTIGLGIAAVVMGLRIRSRFSGELVAFERD